MIIDLVLALLLVGIIVRGRDTGFVRQFFSAIGFIGGLFLGAALQPLILSYITTTASRAIVAFLVSLSCALLVSTIGDLIGGTLKFRFLRSLMLNKLDGVLGSIAGVLTILAAVWLLTPITRSLPAPELQKTINGSWVISTINRLMPSAPNFVAGLDHLINPNGFPDVFADFDRQPLDPDTPLPELGDLRAGVEKARASIVKIEGRGCGGTVEGSGFVAAANIVVTNAHVIAGVDDPKVVDTTGYHSTTVIWFDPDLDLAILRTTDLNLAPLVISTTIVDAGTASVVAGYPGGGGFTASPSAILEQLDARGRDIYGKSFTNRSVYELKADIVSGNSGGPLIDKNGTVIGLVFAESATYDDIGYALTMGAVQQGIDQAIRRDQVVDTASCAE